jgi:hypothetical protein
MKIPPLGAEFFHEDGRTDRRKNITMLVVNFRNFANTSKDLKLILIIIIIITISWYLIVSSIPAYAYVIFG